MSEPTFKPCPFCGTKPRYLPFKDGFYTERVICDECSFHLKPEQGQPRADKYDDVLTPFLSLMRKELHANSRKGDRPGWQAMDANTALLEVYWHVAKLSAAAKNNDGPAIQEHSADVANMAMMVLDICGGLAWTDHP